MHRFGDSERALKSHERAVEIAEVAQDEAEVVQAISQDGILIA